MGVTDLMKVKIVNPQSEYDGQTIADMGILVDLKSLKGERVCFDVSNIIYASILAMKFVTSLTDAEGKPTSHILTIMNKILMAKKLGVRQVWIFDSPEGNPLKTAELAKRAAKRAKSKNDKVLFKMTGEQVLDIKTLLTHMGIMYIVAPQGIEAEQYGAMLTMGEPGERFCKYMISGDTDVLAFGGNVLRPPAKKSGEKAPKTGTYVSYENDNILQEMNMTREEFVTMCVALGTDFSEKTARVGPVTIHKKVQDGEINLTPEQQVVYDYFMNPVELQEAHLVENQYNKEALKAFLEIKGFNFERYEKRIDQAYAKD
jgi:flap endonuclease-1